MRAGLVGFVTENATDFVVLTFVDRVTLAGGAEDVDMFCQIAEEMAHLLAKDVGGELSVLVPGRDGRGKDAIGVTRFGGHGIFHLSENQSEVKQLRNGRTEIQ